MSNMPKVLYFEPPDDDVIDQGTIYNSQEQVERIMEGGYDKKVIGIYQLVDTVIVKPCPRKYEWESTCPKPAEHRLGKS